MIDRYLAETVPHWRHPDDEPPPLGTKLLLLLRGGTACIGIWDPQVACIAWCPLPKVSSELRERLSSAQGHM